MSVYCVEVELTHQDTKRKVRTWVSVEAPYESSPQVPQLTAAQLATAHRLGFMPTSTRIIAMEA